MNSIRAAAVLLVMVVAVANPFTQAWIASKFVVDDGLEPSDAVVALRAEPEEERQRMEEAARLVTRNYAPVMLLSTDARPFFGVRERQLVEAYFQRQGFPTARLRICENTADSTAEEARFLLRCLQQMGAKQVIVVTSEFHTRRSRLIFRNVFSGAGIIVRVHPVYIQEYWDPHWWRRRRWAKTQFDETAKLIWTAIGQWLPHRQAAAAVLPTLFRRANMPVAPSP